MATHPHSKTVRFEGLEGRQLLASINVSDFGARANDGADDAAAIRAAIKASKAGDTINFGSGVYNVNSVVNIASDRTYKGNGTTLKRPAGTDFILSTDATTQNFTVDGFVFDGAGITFYGPQASNVKIINNTFQNLTGGWTVGNAMVLPKGMKNSLIEGNTFKNIWGETGIFGFGAWDNTTIRNNRFEDVMEGIHMLYNGDGLKIQNNTFVRVKRMGIELQGTDAKNTLIEANHLSEWRDRYHESFALSIVNFGDNAIIRNNYISSGKPGQVDPQAKQAPIGIEAAGRKMIIEGNIVEGFNEGVHLMYNPDTVVRNNTFLNQTWMAVWRTGVQEAPRVTVENNIIINPATYAFLWQGSAAGQTGTVIRNNRIELKGKAYEFEGNKAGVTLQNVINKGVSSLPTLPNAGVGGTTGAPTTPTTPNNPTPPVVVEPEVPVGNGNGLKGEYYNQVNFTGPVVTRVDSTVDFNWAYGSPMSQLTNDYYSVRWTGQVEAPVSGEYTFTITGDDGIRLWVDGKLVADGWRDQAASTYSGKITLQAGKKYDIKMEHYDKTGESVARLFWTLPGSSSRVIIPSSQLSTTYGNTETPTPTTPNPSPEPEIPTNPDPETPPAGAGLLGEYYNGVNFSGTAIQRNDPNVNFNWGYGAPVAQVANEYFSVRWTGQVTAPTSGEYTFTITGDDGIRLYVDGKLVADGWKDQALSTYNGKITLQAGQKYDIKLEYYEKTGESQAKLLWTTPGGSQQVIPTSALSTSFAGTPTTPTTPTTPEVTAPVSGTGNGLLGEYYKGTALSGTAIKRTDATVNFNWGYGSPMTQLPNDLYSVRWSGSVLAPTTGEYTFAITGDDGIRLWVDGKLIADGWRDQALSTYTGKITLQAGQKYDIKLEYYEKGNESQAKLLWQTPGSSSRVVIPQSQLSSSIG